MMMLALGIVLGCALGASATIFIAMVCEALDDNIPLTSWEQQHGRR